MSNKYRFHKSRPLRTYCVYGVVPEADGTQGTVMYLTEARSAEEAMIIRVQTEWSYGRVFIPIKAELDVDPLEGEAS